MATARSQLGLGSVTAATTATWLMTPELYDTHIRSTAHSMAYCVARLGAMSSSYVVDSDMSDTAVGVILMCTCLLGSYLSFKIPTRISLNEGNFHNDL